MGMGIRGTPKERGKKWLKELWQVESKGAYRWKGGGPGRTMNMSAVVRQTMGTQVTRGDQEAKVLLV